MNCEMNPFVNDQVWTVVSSISYSKKMYSFSVIVAISVLWAIWYLQALAANHLKARRTGFPIYISPVNQDNLLWLIFSVPLRPLFSRFLPAFAFDRIKVAIYGWEYILRNSVQEKLGATFLLVTPGRNELWTTDPEIAQIVLQRRKDFVHLDISKRASCLCVRFHSSRF